MYLAHLSGSAQSLGRLVSPKLTKLTDRFRRSTSTPTSSSPMSSTSAAAAVTARGNQYTSYAEEQFTKAGGSGLYDRARPDYPAEAVSRILARLPRQQQQEQRAGENQGNLIVELGSGTGIFTRLLLKAGGGGAGQGSFKRLLCVEPSAGMRQDFEAKLKEQNLPAADSGIRVECVDGLFDSIPSGDATVDLVVAAQAFHWTGKDGGSAIKEIARVLKPGGTAVFIWNLEDRSQPWVAKLRDAYEQYEAGTPQYRHMLWKSIYDLDVYKSNFEPHEYEQFSRAIPGSEDLVVDRLVSKSYITALDDEKQKELVSNIRDIVRSADDKVWIDKEQGTFEYPYKTDVYFMARK